MKHLSLLLLFVFPFVVLAQTQDQLEPSSFSLKEAIDYALEQNFTIKNAQLQKELSQAKKGEVRGALLPQVSGNLDYNHSFQVQKNILENGVGLINRPDLPQGAVIPTQLSLANQILPSLNA